jgi:hypothetical protein
MPGATSVAIGSANALPDRWVDTTVGHAVGKRVLLTRELSDMRRHGAYPAVAFLCPVWLETEPEANQKRTRSGAEAAQERLKSDSTMPP